jgi:soluble lytic murein transglycosylase
MGRASVVLLLGLVIASCSSSKPVGPAAAPAASLSLFSSDKSFAEGVQLVESKRYAEAVSPLRSLRGSDERLEDYYLYYLGVAEVRSGDASRATGRFLELRTQYPQSVWAPAAALELGKIYRQQGKTQEAEAFLAVASSAADRGTAANAQLEQAQLLMALGRNQEAAQLLIDLRQQARGTSAAPQARTLLRTLRQQDPSLALQGRQWLDEARLLLDERDYLGAEKAARTADPSGVDAESRLLLAEAEKGQGNSASAISTLGLLVERAPDDPLASKALFRMAQLLWNQDEDVSAEAAFLQFVKRYPNDPSAPEALYALGRIQQSMGHPSEAMATYEGLAQHYPSAKSAWEARWRVGWIRYSTRDFSRAAAAFAQLARASKDSADVAAARYWQGRSLERSGRVAEANEIYRGIVEQQPLSYYAGRAEERLGEEHFDYAGRVQVPRLPLPEPPPTANAYHVQRYLALRELGLSGLARGEAAALEREASDDAAKQFVYYAYANADDYPAARRVGRELDIPAGVRERVLYPLAFWGDISAASGRNQVDPLLVVSLIRQESLFDPAARSPADARGLMQLLPSTGRKEATALGWKEDPTERLQDPEVNVALGVHHLRSLIDQYDGDVVKALAAYNGGTGAVDKWQRQFAELDGDEFVESISYRETRDYVKRVLGNRRAYARLYASGS